MTELTVQGHVNNTRYLDFADMATNYYLSIYRIIQSSSNCLVENCKLDPLSTTDPIALAVNTVANYFEPVSFRISLQFRGFANL
jgi:acyl-CoA thioesterase FadM